MVANFCSGDAMADAVFEADGTAYGLALRHRRYDLGFVLQLDDFHHEFHPGTRKAKSMRAK